METILFIGDSITDADRTKTPEGQDLYIGNGYPFVVSSYLSYEYVDKYLVLNRGISGNRSVDIYSRLKTDCINLKPDYVSILVGVNDVWLGVYRSNGVDTDRFEAIYELMILDIKRYLPDTGIIIMEPFVLPGNRTENTEDQKDRWSLLHKGVREKASVARKLAEKYNLPFVPLQDILLDRAEHALPGSVLRDGVHPSTYGHTIIGKEWIKAFEANYIKK